MAMGNRRQPAAINRKNMDFKVLGRVLGYMMKRYKFRFILVLVCILITAVTTLVGMLFMQSLIDDYITPMLNVVNSAARGAGAYRADIRCGHYKLLHL